MVELTALQAQRNPIVAACITLRMLVFSEITFAYQNRRNGILGDMFTSSALSLLENPWPNASTTDLLARMEFDASLYGNSYWVSESSGLLTRLDPMKVDIATTDITQNSSGQSIGKRLIGYNLRDDRQNTIAAFSVEQVAHYAPIPDPGCEFRGISWLSQLLQDVLADTDLTEFKHAYLSNGATPNLVVKFGDKVSKDTAKGFRDALESGHTGPQQGFKTLYLGAGADVSVVGSNFEGLMLNSVQAAGETRIATAAGVPPTLLSLSEGMKGSALNSGNYASTRRRFSDGTIRPMWRKACSALQTLVPPLFPGPRLWYLENDVPFLQEDLTDAATSRQMDATTIRTLTDGGYEPDSVVKAVSTNDLSQLVHSGLLSVQLQPITEKSAEAKPPTPSAPALNGAAEPVPAA
jgi:hypothetical protein